MVYVRKGPYVDVLNQEAPPAGAKHIDAEYLNGVEDYLEAQDTANATYATSAGVAGTYATKAALDAQGGVIEDPARPGIYSLASVSTFTEDPARPGIYTIGA